MSNSTWRAGTAVAGIAALAIALCAHQALAQNNAPCKQIEAACEQAGFKKGGSNEGLGLQLDCIAPIMKNAPQRASAAKPLPTVDTSVVAACRAKHPDFGQAAAAAPSKAGKPAPSQTAGGQAAGGEK
jgi:hypothetical protein